MRLNSLMQIFPNISAKLRQHPPSAKMKQERFFMCNAQKFKLSLFRKQVSKHNIRNTRNLSIFSLETQILIGSLQDRKQTFFA